MKKLTALMAAAALLGSTTLAPAMYAPIQNGLTGGIILAQAAKDEKDKMGKKDKAKPKPKAKEKKMKDKDKDKEKEKEKAK
jgi:hypothetical protein